MRIFFWIAAILSALFGAMMFFAPGFAAQSFSLAASPGTDTVFRILGSTLLGVGIMNLLAANQPASPALRIVLWTDFAIHLIGTIADVWSVSAGELAFSAAVPGFVSHAIIGLGALYFLLMRRQGA